MVASVGGREEVGQKLGLRDPIPVTYARYVWQNCAWGSWNSFVRRAQGVSTGGSLGGEATIRYGTRAPVADVSLNTVPYMTWRLQA